MRALTTAGSPITAREANARAAKASAIAHVLHDHGATPAVAAVLGPQARADAARAAGVRTPSETTWAVVLEMLAALQAVPTNGDPWENFPGPIAALKAALR